MKRLLQCIAGNEAYDKAAAALSFVSDTKAIILDQSDNGGGDGRMGTFIGAYFMGTEKPVTMASAVKGKRTR